LFLPLELRRESIGASTHPALVSQEKQIAEWLFRTRRWQAGEPRNIVSSPASWFAQMSSDDVFTCSVLAIVAVLQIPQYLRHRRRKAQARAGAAASRSESIGPVAARMRRLLKPTLLLVSAQESEFSKLGGLPELPPDLRWPEGHGRPRGFLAQIDMGEIGHLSAIDWLPQEGRLYAFHDSAGLDDSDAVRVLYSCEPPGGAVIAPPGIQRPYVERRVGFTQRNSAPSLDWLGLDASDLDMDDEALEALDAIGDAPPPDEIQHRIGGYPNEIQPEQMALLCEHRARGLPDPAWGEDVASAIERAAREWRLLLQIDSDPELKMNFGDSGRLYVFIRERHARAGDFSKTVTLWQTY
jgi:uncharacterized protein YwqG